MQICITVKLRTLNVRAQANKSFQLTASNGRTVDVPEMFLGVSAPSNEIQNLNQRRWNTFFKPISFPAPIASAPNHSDQTNIRRFYNYPADRLRKRPYDECIEIKF